MSYESILTPDAAHDCKCGSSAPSCNCNRPCVEVRGRFKPLVSASRPISTIIQCADAPAIEVEGSLVITNNGISSILMPVSGVPTQLNLNTLEHIKNALKAAEKYAHALACVPDDSPEVDSCADVDTFAASPYDFSMPYQSQVRCGLGSFDVQDTVIEFSDEGIESVTMTVGGGVLILSYLEMQAAVALLAKGKAEVGRLRASFRCI